ncbi:MAG TPA: NADH-quinone oxidoreductase subunit C [Armatimonadota bacterium]|nr:NADH-quinone oxidoreductase subunit C [Armatimonadota bacterium]
MTENSADGNSVAEEEEPQVPEVPVPDDIVEMLGDAIVEASVSGTSVNLTLKAEGLVEAITALRDREAGAYNFLANLCGIDHGEELGVAYHIYQLGKPEHVAIHVRVPREEPVVPSLASVFRAANWNEREAAEMYGIVFESHPDPRKLLLPDDWEGFPMRKDYEIPDHPYLRPDPTHELG